jgi:hypothetical protein
MEENKHKGLEFNITLCGRTERLENCTELTPTCHAHTAPLKHGKAAIIMFHSKTRIVAIDMRMGGAVC